MGTVWMAQQTEPVKRLVAIKLIKPGMDSKQVIARFEAERQVLALMDHPNIARVLDGGTSDAGRPYVVMDLVKGVPITKYCDEHRLTPNQRLELFIPVCQAIQHAHQKGIIHRDIKPSNILVGEAIVPPRRLFRHHTFVGPLSRRNRPFARPAAFRPPDLVPPVGRRCRNPAGNRFGQRQEGTNSRSVRLLLGSFGG